MNPRPIALGVASIALGAAALVASTLVAPAPAGPADPMLEEVATQCASEVTATFDVAAEGVDDPSTVPSPLWEDLVAQCRAEFVAGATWEEAPTRVLARYDW